MQELFPVDKLIDMSKCCSSINNTWRSSVFKLCWAETLFSKSWRPLLWTPEGSWLFSTKYSFFSAHTAKLDVNLCLCSCDPGGPRLGQREGAARPRHCELLWRRNPRGNDRLWRSKRCTRTHQHCQCLSLLIMFACGTWSSHIKASNGKLSRCWQQVQFWTSYHTVNSTDRTTLCRDLEKEDVIDFCVWIVAKTYFVITW